MEVTDNNITVTGLSYTESHTVSVVATSAVCPGVLNSITVVPVMFNIACEWNTKDNWGERSEPYRSDECRQFLCMYVCMYVCMSWYGRPDSRFLHTRSYTNFVYSSCILHNWRHKKKLHKMNPDNESKQERLRIRRDRHRQARAQETAEEKEVRLAKRTKPCS